MVRNLHILSIFNHESLLKPPPLVVGDNLLNFIYFAIYLQFLATFVSGIY